MCCVVQDDPKLDGCTVLFDSLPGGSQYGLDLGLTLVHETGEGHHSGVVSLLQTCSCCQWCMLLLAAHAVDSTLFP
jgi:hypothetical protein